MTEFIGQSNNLFLFADGNRGVIVDSKLNAVVASGFADVLIDERDWDKTEAPKVTSELAAASLTSLDVVVAAAGGRLYTIPKNVQNEAKRGLQWHKDNHRGGTDVGMNTARILSKGGQIGLDKLRHIAKYFPRHAVDKKGKGWSQGEGYPSNGRIAWALWGGDAAERWASNIVETANKKSITADGFGLPDYDFVDPSVGPDMSAFDDALNISGEQGPEFLARVRMDGSGIDRLYKVDPDGTTSVWDDMDWETLGEVGGDIWTYDKALDDPYGNVDTTHVIIDPESAIMLAAHFTESPFEPVSIEDLVPEEAYLAADAADDIDYDMIDSTIVAAAPAPGQPTQPGDGQYTEAERSQNASKQQRDGNGKFAKVGGRVLVDKNPRMAGTITGIDPTTGKATVALENGGAPVQVDVKQTTAITPQTQTISGQTAGEPAKVDLSGILAEPRTPIDRTQARLPGTLPQMTADDVHQLLNDWASYVQSQRVSDSVPEPGKVKVNKNLLDVGPEGRAIEKATGKKIILDGYKHPLLKDWLKKSVNGRPNSIYYQPLTAAAPTDVDPSAEPVPDPTMDSGQEVTPDTTDVSAVYMAIVAPDDPTAVLNLIALVPASSTSTEPMTYERKDGKWVRNPQFVNDLKSATPPPVVPLDTDVLQDVLKQVDATQAGGDDASQPAAPTSAPTPSAPAAPAPAPSAAAPVAASISPDFALTVLWGREAATAMVAAGGPDRNRGNAEKLRRYWTVGPGGAKIMWGTGGDWTRCVRHLGKYLGTRAKGYCALRHKEMTGMWTGDKKHRKIFGRTGTRSFSNDTLKTEEAVIASAWLRAEKASLHNRVKGITAAATAEEVSPGAPFTIPLVIPEGVESGDGRIFKPEAITMRDLPLPLLWQQESADGHSGSVVVGRIDSMERVDNGIGNAHGVFDNGEYGREAERLVRNGFLRGVSADMDQFEATPEKQKAELGLGDDDEPNEIKQDRLIISKSRIMAVTIVPKPAFQECSINIDETPESQEDTVIPDGIYVDEPDSVEASALVAAGYVASSIPLAPPADWFNNPGLTQATPLTVDDDGRVFGHIASWQQDHIGRLNTRAPRSRSNYAYFHTGVVRTEEGTDIPVGQLTLAGGHASLEASAAEAVKHYDDTASAIADVHAGEDQYGIWVAGSLRPGAQPEQIRALRASAPSGDWRPVKGQLELVAVCQVNVPGFPVARAMVASGQVYALVAAGAMTLAKMKNDPVADLNNRLRALEDGRNQELSIKAAEIRNRVHAVIDPAKQAQRAELSAKAEALSARMSEVTDFAFIPKKKRDELASKGHAMPDGSFPISNEGDLKKAIHAFGRTTDDKKAAVKKHIMKRARSLGKANLIPDNWNTAQSDAITASLERMRATIAERSGESEFANPKGLTPQQEKQEETAKRILEQNNPALIADDAAAPKQVDPGKYTPKTQPRDEQGKFRLILARLRNDLGTSGNQAVLDKIKAVENLDNAGNYKAATDSAADLYNTLDRMDEGALDKDTRVNLRMATTQLSKTIANLPLPFANQAQKVRFSDLPPALREMSQRFINKVTQKMGTEKAAPITAEMKSFMSGAEVFSQSEINAQLNRLLRYLD